MKILRAHWVNTVRRLSILISSVILIALTTVAAISAQQPDPSIKTTQVFGKVSEINSSAGQITIKTAAGSTIVASVNEKTTYQRMPPGETDRTKAEQTSLTEITVGDGVVARGFVAADKKSVPAQQIIVVSQSEMAQKNQAERMAWARGAKGIVSSLNPSTKEVTVTSRSLAGASQAITVALSDKANIKRFPPDSIPRYKNAKAGKFEDIKVGDQFNAKGEKTADGLHLNAEEVLFGSFKVVGGTVTSIDAANGQIKINDLQTKKPLTIILKPESVIRRLPENMMMAMGGGMGGPGGPGGPNAGGPRPQGPGQPQGQPQGQAQTAQGPGPQGQRPQGPGGPGGNGMRPGGGGSMADLL